MAKSVRAKLKTLNYKGILNNADYNELISKLDGHDRELIKESYRNDLDTIAREICIRDRNAYMGCKHVLDELREEALN